MSTTTPFDFGRFLKVGRSSKGMTQKQFAEHAGVSVRWLAKAEANGLSTKVRPTHVQMVAKALDRDPGEVLALLRQEELINFSVEGKIDESSVEIDRIKSEIFKMQWPALAKEQLLAWISMFAALPGWRVDLLAMCKELSEVESVHLKPEIPEPEITISFRRWAAEVAYRKTIQRLKLITRENAEIRFDDVNSVEPLWSGIFSRATRIWATNVARLGTFGGRNDSEQIIDLQRKACKVAENDEYLTRLFVLNKEEFPKQKDYERFILLLYAQWDAGIKIGLINPTLYSRIVSDFGSSILSPDYMLLNNQIVYFTELTPARDSILGVTFSVNEKHVSSVIKINSELMRRENTEWFDWRLPEDDERQRPNFEEAVEMLALRESISAP